MNIINTKKPEKPRQYKKQDITKDNMIMKRARGQLKK
jgi:hypothetical protein